MLAIRRPAFPPSSNPVELPSLLEPAPYCGLLPFTSTYPFKWSSLIPTLLLDQVGVLTLEAVRGSAVVLVKIGDQPAVGIERERMMVWRGMGFGEKGREGGSLWWSAEDEKGVYTLWLYGANETDMSTIHRLFRNLPPLASAKHSTPAARQSSPSPNQSLLTLPGAPSPVTSILYQKYRNSILLLDDETQQIISVVPLHMSSASTDGSEELREGAGSTGYGVEHERDDSVETIRNTKEVERTGRATTSEEISIGSTCDGRGSVLSDRARKGNELLDAAMGPIEPFASPPFFHELERSLASIQSGIEEVQEAQPESDSTSNSLDEGSDVARSPQTNSTIVHDAPNDKARSITPEIPRPDESAVLLSFLAGSSSIFAARDITAHEVERDGLVAIGTKTTEGGWKWLDLFGWRGFGLGPFVGLSEGGEAAERGSGWMDWLSLNWFRTSSPSANDKFEPIEVPTAGPTSYFFFPDFAPTKSKLPATSVERLVREGIADRKKRVSVLFVDGEGIGKRAYVERTLMI